MMNPHELEKYAQVISLEMMEGLKNSAQVHGITLEMEVALRLMANAGAEMSEGAKLFNKITQRKFTTEEAVAESKRNREGALYRYEMAKLTLFLEHEHILPRQIKEIYTMIDVEEESKRIREDIKRRRKEAGEDEIGGITPLSGAPIHLGGQGPKARPGEGKQNPTGKKNPKGRKNLDGDDDGELV